MENDGNGWVRCGQGHRHWGRHGAAGLLLVDRRRPAPLVLLQHRAGWTANGGTWGVPGGARDSHESPRQAALREAFEEAGITPDAVAVRDELVDDHGAGWSYTTVLAELLDDVRLVPQAESEELRWTPVPAVAGLPLHPGFARSWPVLQERLGGVPTG